MNASFAFARLLRLFLSLVLSAALLRAAAAEMPAHAAEPLPEIRIGYIEASFSPSERKAFAHTFLYLSAKLPQYRFTIRPYLVKDLDEAVRTKSIDFFLAASGFYRRLNYRGLRDLATLVTPTTASPDLAVGTVFLVKKDSPYRSFDDLKGLRAAANWQEGFTGVYVPMGEIAARGYDPDDSLSFSLAATYDFGFMKLIFKVIEEEQPTHFVVTFDVHAPTFRHKMYDAYKGTRKPMPGELREQVPVMKDVLEAMGVNIVSKEGYEADDILGTLAKKSEAQGMDVTILSGDRDLLQLATDHICIRIPKTKGGKTTIEDYDAKDVVEAYQLTPPQIIELKALMGDSADNIPGLPGVGEKTATKLLLEYGTAENAYAHVEEIKPKKAQNAFLEHYDLAVLSRKLATINTDSPVDLDREKAKVHDFYTQEAYEFFKELEFKNFLSRFQDKGEEIKAEEYFQTITDFALAEEIFQNAEQKEGI